MGEPIQRDNGKIITQKQYDKMLNDINKIRISLHSLITKVNQIEQLIHFRTLRTSKPTVSARVFLRQNIKYALFDLLLKTDNDEEIKAEFEKLKREMKEINEQW